MPKTRVFVDTNVILEAFKTGVWTAICHTYAVETVEKCIEEALTGDPNTPGYVYVDPQLLMAGLAGRHQVDKQHIVGLFYNHPHCQGLDDGELHLIAWLDANEKPSNTLVLVSTADKAAIVATCKIGMSDSLESLEALASNSGVTKGQLDSLPAQHKSKRLSEIKLQVAMGVIP